MYRCWHELCLQNFALSYWLPGSHMFHGFKYHQYPDDFWISVFNPYLSFEHWLTFYCLHDISTWIFSCPLKLPHTTLDFLFQLCTSICAAYLHKWHFHLLCCTDTEHWGYPWLTPFFLSHKHQYRANPVGQYSKIDIISRYLWPLLLWQFYLQLWLSLMCLSQGSPNLSPCFYLCPFWSIFHDAVEVD